MFFAWAIYRQYSDEPFNQFFRLFWKMFFTWHVADVTGDEKKIIIKNAPIPLEDATEREEAEVTVGSRRASTGSGVRKSKAANEASRAGGGQGIATLELK